jgi:branched-chain amino acid transport system ATP-binding protein
MKSSLSGSRAAPPLVLEQVIAGVGAITILDCVSLRLDAAEVVTVLGANGAGKTTLLRTIAGLTLLRAGRIRLFGEPIEGWPPHVIARAGIGHVPSGRELFPRLTV